MDWTDEAYVVPFDIWLEFTRSAGVDPLAVGFALTHETIGVEHVVRGVVVFTRRNVDDHRIQNCHHALVV